MLEAKRELETGADDQPDLFLKILRVELAVVGCILGALITPTFVLVPLFFTLSYAGVTLPMGPFFVVCLLSALGGGVLGVRLSHILMNAIRRHRRRR